MSARVFKSFLKRAVQFLMVLSLLWQGTVHAAAVEKWSGEVYGEAVLEGRMTVDIVKNLCLNRAKARAIEEVNGTYVSEETFVLDNAVIADLVRAQTNAWIKDYKIIKWEEPKAISQTPGSPPLIRYRVCLKALVVIDKEAVSDFNLKVDLNRGVFYSGDEMRITIQSTRDCYLTVFSVLPDEGNKVTVLVPSRYQEKRFSKKGTPYVIPDQDASGSERKLKLFNQGKKGASREAILAVATLNDTDVIQGSFAAADRPHSPNLTGSFRDLLDRVMKVPSKERAMAIKYYEIREAGKNAP